MNFDSAEMRSFHRTFKSRRLRFALAVSIALHGWLLWSSAPAILSRDSAPVLSASLRPFSPEPAPVPPAPTLPVPKTQPKEIKPAPVSPIAVPQPVAPAAAPAAVSTSPVVDSAVAAGLPTTNTTAPNSPTTVAVSADAADGLRGYRLALATQARRFKRYPPQAMASGWKGTAEIRLELSADGQPRPAVVQRSSGYESLDRAAQAMIDAGAQRAQLPDGLRGKAFAVVLPVVFNLDEP